MEPLTVTPIGYGNYQYVLRIHSKENQFKFCVLKISKEQLGDYRNRIGFHEKFNTLISSLNSESSLLKEASRRRFESESRRIRIESNRKSGERGRINEKLVCLISKAEARKIRLRFSKLVNKNLLNNRLNTFRENYRLINDALRPEETSAKVVLFYDKYLEENNSFEVGHSLRVLYRLSDGPPAHGVDSVDFEDDELCTIENDLLSNSYIYHYLLNNDRRFRRNVVNSGAGRNGLTNGLNSDFNRNLINLCVELKLKCGLVNFSGLPSLFRLGQFTKRRTEFFLYNGFNSIISRTESHYDPVGLFTLDPAEVRRQVSQLFENPQNNLKIFINNYQYNRLVRTLRFNNNKFKLVIHNYELEYIVNENLKRGKQVARTGFSQRILVDLIVYGLLHNHRKLLCLLKLQALSAGQQFLGPFLFGALGIFLRCLPWKLGVTPLGDRFQANDPVCVLRRFKLLRKFHGGERNHYQIQFLFYKYGVVLILKFVFNLLHILSTSRNNCLRENSSLSRLASTKRRSLNLSRPSSILTDSAFVSVLGNGRRSRDECGLSLIQFDEVFLKEVFKFYYRQFVRHSTNNSNCTNSNNNNYNNRNNNKDYKVNNINGKLKVNSQNHNHRSNSTVNHSTINHTNNNIYKLISDKNTKISKDGNRSIKRSIMKLIHLKNLKIAKIVQDWIYLYLIGRVSMDLSVVLNMIISPNSAVVDLINSHSDSDLNGNDRVNNVGNSVSFRSTNDGNCPNNGSFGNNSRNGKVGLVNGNSPANNRDQVISDFGAVYLNELTFIDTDLKPLGSFYKMSDDVVWQLIKNGFCSFRKLTDTKAFCSNVYNVTGLCNHASCPLANSNYATVIEDQGKLLLCVKRSEKAHLPREMWEKVPLPSSERLAFSAIQQRLKFGISSHLVRKCYRKFRRLRETLALFRRAAQRTGLRILPRKKKTERRESSREFRALLAAKLERSVESELLQRLSSGLYGTKMLQEESKTTDFEELKLEEDTLSKSQRKKRGTMNIEYELEDAPDLNTLQQ